MDTPQQLIDSSPPVSVEQDAATDGDYYWILMTDSPSELQERVSTLFQQTPVSDQAPLAVKVSQYILGQVTVKYATPSLSGREGGCGLRGRTTCRTHS